MATTGSSDEREYFEQRDEQLARRLGREHGVSRRDLLKLGAAGSLLLGAGAFGRPGWAAAQQAPAGPIVKPLPPEWFIPIGTNAEMRWEAMRGQGYFTPSERFFVRNHTATPLIDKRAWRLRIFGSGLRRPEGIELDYRDLLRLPARSRAAFIECAGNGRSFFTSQQGTPASGSQWKLGAVGVAHWRGVPLGEVLERAGISRRAVDVMPQGLDATVVSNGVDQGHVRRPLPVGKAFDDVLLAYEMNGKPLPPDHGAPVRLVVPGWVGIASIKWLGQIEVADQPLFSPWNTTQYRMVGPDYPADSPPLTAQQVKSAFELPWEATLPGRSYGHPARPLLVGRRADPARRGAGRRRGGAGRGGWASRARVFAWPARLAARSSVRSQPAAGVGALEHRRAPARGWQLPAPGPRDRPGRHHAARQRSVQHRRLPVLGRRAAPGQRCRVRSFQATHTRSEMALQLGDTAPDFEAETTEGTIRFHDWVGDSWAVLFSHPRNFTPVCTTELGYMASIKPEFDRRGVKILGLSVDPIENHAKWAEDIADTQGTAPNYPLVADGDFEVSKAYGMLAADVEGDPTERTPALNQTVRNVFVIGPDKKIKLILVYPMTTGRNFDEVLRVIDSLQLTAKHKVATPVNWTDGDDVIIAGSVSDDEARETYPDGWDSPRPYIRIVPQPR